MPCIGCNYSHPNPASQSNHERQCRSRTLALVRILQERQAQLQGEQQAVTGLPPPSTDSVPVARTRMAGPPAQNQDIAMKAPDSNFSELLNISESDLLPGDRYDPFPPVIEAFPRRPSASTRHNDDIPSPPAISAGAEMPEQGMDIPEAGPLVFKTRPNHFGIFRCYPFGRPTYSPDLAITNEDISDAPTFQRTTASRALGQSWWSQLGTSFDAIEDPESLGINKSTYLFLEWFWDPTSTTKTYTDADKLIRDVIRHPDFDTSHFAKFLGTQRETERLDAALKKSQSDLPFSDDWARCTLPLSLPCPNFPTPENEAPQFDVEHMYYRPLLDVVKASLEDPSAEFWNFAGYREYWQPSPDSPSQRTVSEIYNSDTFLELEEEVKKLAAGQPLEACVIALMFWSDSTHFTSFGTASLWPIYLYIGNISKYIRSKPTSFTAHHLAYIPKLPDTVNEFYVKEFQRPMTDELRTFLRKELFQQVWLKLLDDDFMHAHDNGFEWTCVDGVKRLLFPRVISYSADYPEKCQIACIKSLGKCPCPRCLVPKDKIPNLGMPSDDNYRYRHSRIDNHHIWYDINRARSWLFDHGRDIRTVRFRRLLDRQSLTPSRSAFSQRFEHSPSFNLYRILSPDGLHEGDMGALKAILTHLVRMLDSLGADKIAELNARYRALTPFGRGTIRGFPNDFAALRRMAGRDWEDSLQCAIPCFRGLFRTPMHNDFVLKLLFEFATWHSLAKLRRHTEATVADLRASTIRLGEKIRHFVRVICPKYATKDLKREVQARVRALANKGKSTSSAQTMKRRVMNMVTFKLHALGHYADCIMDLGPTDNYNTQTGECQHRHVKRWYKRVRKGGDTYVAGIARQQHRERTLFNLRAAAAKKRNQASTAMETKARLYLPLDYTEKLERAPSHIHHQMSKQVTAQNRLNILQFIAENPGDPALKDFYVRLKTHLLNRVLGKPYSGDEELYSMEDLQQIIVDQDTLFLHNTMRINYTTYDMRRDQDTIRVKRQSDIMMRAYEDSPEGAKYWWARVIAIAHVRVIHNTPAAALSGVRAQEMEVLWIRWFGPAANHVSGWAANDLPRIGFVNERGRDQTMSFGFLDPAEVIRAAHLIPAYEYKRGHNGMPKTIARPEEDKGKDWNYFYVNIFVDRDMFMRFRGGGIGHVSTRETTDRFLDDRDPTDLPDSPEEDEMETDEEEYTSEEGDSELEGEDEENAYVDEAIEYQYEFDSESDPEGSDEDTGEGDGDVEVQPGPGEGDDEPLDDLLDEVGLAEL